MSWFGKKKASPDVESELPVNVVYELLKHVFSSSTQNTIIKQIISPDIECRFSNLVNDVEISRKGFECFWELFCIGNRENINRKQYFIIKEQICKQLDSFSFDVNIVTEEMTRNTTTNLWGVYEVHRNIMVTVKYDNDSGYFKIASYLETLLDKKFIHLVQIDL